MKSLERMAKDKALTPEQRLECARLVVRLFVAGSAGVPVTKGMIGKDDPRSYPGGFKVKDSKILDSVSSEKVKQLLESLDD
ncbi:MAG TPA: hypothetical protein VHU83_06740 [Bryobacteraceae bacterium]|nr:hypothetical protein [Bryobacteraceae bacterium]